MTTLDEATAGRRRLLPLVEGEESRVSPDWVRISMASAFALRMRSGRFSRRFDFGGINLLLNYASGCRSDCSYCGLARTRPGTYEDKSFIRVEWPLVRTDDLIERMTRYEEKLTRLCISMVTHGRAFPDTVNITERIKARVDTPLSILVAPPTLNRERLEAFKGAGVDMIGIGLDAVTEDLFRRHRTDVPSGGGLSWGKYWEVVDDSRDLFGPWKVNCHTLVGLGETDAEIIDLFHRLSEREVFSYLFCFNPEPDSRMGDEPKTPIHRWRRIQLARFLIEDEGFGRERFEFGPEGNLLRIIGLGDSHEDVVERAVGSGIPYMTNGCPGPEGEPGCTRPYGSYRPSEPVRDYPWLPTEEDLVEIRDEMRLWEVYRPGWIGE